MFLAEALYSFSSTILEKQQQAESQQQKEQTNRNQQNLQINRQENSSEREQQSQKHQILKQKENEVLEQNSQRQRQASQNEADEKQQTSEVQYLTFQKGDKIRVEQAYQSGWWYGYSLRLPLLKGFFPSNYVQVTSKPKPPPPPPSEPLPEQEGADADEANSNAGIEWVQNQLKNITQGPLKSDYYLGIKSYKNVKIDEKNQNILKGDHVKFDVSTGLAKVPVKDQAPAAKAVRQMGYYFDYHQWNQARNQRPGQRSRPDIKKKKIKKLNLKGMK